MHGYRPQRCIIPVIHLFAFLLVDDRLSAETVQQIVVTSSLCGQTLNLTRGTTFRLLPSSEKTCDGPEDISFDCKVVVKTNPKSLFDELCVDFSRIRPQDENSTLSLYFEFQNVAFRTDANLFSVDLTNERYPARRKYMSTVTCGNNFHRQLVLHFKSDCSRTPSEAFVSWLYVYVKTTETGDIYYVDGNCRHHHSLQREYERVTVRSFVWRDTLREPESQKCSVLLDAFKYDLDKSTLLCPAWTFTHGDPPCGTEIQWNVTSVLNRNVVSQGRRSCGKSDDLQTCVRESYTVDAMIGVERNRQREIAWQIQEPGHQLFDTKVTVQIRRPRLYTDDDDNSYTYTGTDDDAGGINSLAKLCLGIAILLITVFCCSVAKMRKKDNNADQAPSYREVERYRPIHSQGTLRSSPYDPPTFQESLLMQHSRERSQTHIYNSHTSVADSSHDLDPGEDSYSRTPAEERGPIATPAAANAPPSYDEVAQRPPDQSAPPSYRDLFPED